MTSAIARVAERTGFRHIEVALSRGTTAEQWVGVDGCVRSVEQSVLAHFAREGWSGYSGEGGLILTLIKCMSFLTVPPCHRMTYIEALYAQNIAFAEHRVPVEQMLATLRQATVDQVRRNFAAISAPRQSLLERLAGKMPQTRSVQDHFPGIECWMLVDLMAVAGLSLLSRIAELFAKDPYTYRSGWPDITMWRNGELRFVEVKAPGDFLRTSQKVIARDIATPLGLEFYLASVLAG